MEFNNIDNITNKQLVELFLNQKREVYTFMMKDFVRVRDAVHVSNTESPDRKIRNCLLFIKGNKKKFIVQTI